MAPSLPRAKTSIRPLPSEVAAGDEVSFPPRFCQLDHDVPIYDLCHRAPSWTLHQKMSDGCLVSTRQGRCLRRVARRCRTRRSTYEPPLVVVLSQMAPSLPRAKTSIRPLPSEVAAGDEVKNPARGRSTSATSHSCHPSDHTRGRRSHLVPRGRGCLIRRARGRR